MPEIKKDGLLTWRVETRAERAVSRLMMQSLLSQTPKELGFRSRLEQVVHDMQQHDIMEKPTRRTLVAVGPIPVPFWVNRIFRI